MGPDEYFVRSEEDQIYNTPEKWYVRDKWVKYALERKKKNKRDFIRLLTLTSTECYDVEFFRDKGLLQTTETGYAPESVTFCECNKERYVLIRNRLPGARDFFGELKYFVGAGTAGFTKRAQKWFPYDVVNLDFTKPGFKHEGKKTSVMADTICKIFMIQGFKKQSFTLLLTLPAIKRADDTTGKKELNNCLNSNLGGKYSEFEDNFLRKYPRAEFPSYREFLLVVVAKLILRYGQSENFDVQCQERHTYIGKGAKAVMITFVFDCEYVGLRDGYGGANPADILAAQYPKRILEIIKTEYKNINKLFAQDKRLERKYLEYTRRSN